MSFNSPINKGQQLMAITAEEAGELTQVCMKLIRKNASLKEMRNDEKFRAKLIEEAGDVLCMLDLMCKHGLFEWDDLEQRAEVKKEKLKVWSTLL